MRAQSAPHPAIFILAAIGMSILMVVLLFSMQGAPGGNGQAAGLNMASLSAQPAAANNPAKASGASAASLGQAYLDLNALVRANSIDEADNVRWSLVRGTPAQSGVLSASNGVDWKGLRKVSLSGAYALPAGGSWSFNATYGEGPGYKNASGVLAGGHCALATVFRVAAIHAGLPNTAKPHKYPIPGFALNETVNIWWGRDDLVIRNSTAQNLYLVWNLSLDGVTVTVTAKK
jgi:hypothetical protein